MNYLPLPELIAVLAMALMLPRLYRRQANDMMRLWMAGLMLIVVEGVARMLYEMPSSPVVHKTMHAVALDAYFLAGMAFFQSATGRLRYLKHSNFYVIACVVPHVLLQTMYGLNACTPGRVMGVAVLGLGIGWVAAALLQRPWIHGICWTVVWLPVLYFGWHHTFRSAAYYSLFVVYAAAAIAFALTLPRRTWGRAMIVSGFGMWSLCFLLHPWVATQHHDWQALVGRVWDLQKFFVTFGLMLSSIEENSAQNEYNALHDTLTGLPNRKLLRDRLEQGVARAKRSGTKLALFNLDLNGFKAVNDSAGHECGDALLKEVARRLGTVTRESDTLARVGGDEFLVVVSEVRGEDALAQGQRLREMLRKAAEYGEWEYTVQGEPRWLRPSVSIGYAIYPDEAVEVDALVRLADDRMYVDKKAPRVLVGRRGPLEALSVA